MPDIVLSSSALLSRDLTPLLRFEITLIICLLACGFLYVLARRHGRRLDKIPIRIHVAGTRGKSSTVRYIAAGFRSAGYTVVAKTTGTEPSLIRPDGTEERIRRWGAPAIREQREFVAAAAKLNAGVIVAEAMAIQPEYLNALERFYIRATDLAITNVRPDHQEQLGDAETAVAEAIAECIPPGGRVFASAEAATEPVRTRAAQAHARIISVAQAAPGDSPESENLLLAAAVCRQYGIDISPQSPVFRDAAPDVGKFRISGITLDGRDIRFANAFSCNDADSFKRIWRHHQRPGLASAFFLSPREDRIVRTRQFLMEISQLAPESHIFIASRNFMLPRLARRCGFLEDRIHLVSPTPTVETLRAIADRLVTPAIVWGIGNYKGAGERVTRLLAESSTPC